ncbi:MAG: glycerol dehydrogenase [Thermoplasmata archaeon]
MTAHFSEHGIGGIDMVVDRKMLMPSVYIQGRGALGCLGQRASMLGKKAFVIGEKVGLSITEKRVRDFLASEHVEIVSWTDAVRECTHAAIDELAREGKRRKAELVIGVGGGKAMDTSKAAAMKIGVPIITVGTQCATNADASDESVVYTENHEYLDVIKLPRNPEVVIEDTEILVGAPPRFIVQGMGDALACKFEAEAYAKARLRKHDREAPCVSALVLADACYNSLVTKGAAAIRDIKKGNITKDVEDIIETVKLISSLAFQNSGTAFAHALHNGLTITHDVRGEHGEIVAYATIVQAAYEKRPAEELGKIIKFCEEVGLPTTLKDLGDPSGAALRTAAEHAAKRDPDIQNMPEEIEPDEILEAIRRVEKRSF